MSFVGLPLIAVDVSPDAFTVALDQRLHAKTFDLLPALAIARIDAVAVAIACAFLPVSIRQDVPLVRGVHIRAEPGRGAGRPSGREVLRGTG